MVGRYVAAQPTGQNVYHSICGQGHRLTAKAAQRGVPNGYQ
jgi:hypothetical protein